MKRCPTCNHIETDDALAFCRSDGSRLVSYSLDSDSTRTAILPSDRSSVESTTRPTQDTPSIAVLPFTHMSADPDNEYFCDGLAEELLDALAKVEGLKVAARTSAFSFKGKEADIGEIGRRLKVRTVLEGSVRKARPRLPSRAVRNFAGVIIYARRAAAANVARRAPLLRRRYVAGVLNHSSPGELMT